MNKIIEEKFVNNFIIKEKRTRTLYELNSAKKREQIIQRLFNLTDKRYAVLYGNKVSENEVFNIIKQYVDTNKKCYIIADSKDDGQQLFFNEAFTHMMEYGVCYIIICENETAVIREEISSGTPPICVLHKTK